MRIPNGMDGVGGLTQPHIEPGKTFAYEFALEVSGTHAATMLNAGCPLDLDLAEFPVGMCTRTVFAKADVVLWRTRSDAFHLEVWRSFAGYVSGLLAEIATEFYPG